MRPTWHGLGAVALGAVLLTASVGGAAAFNGAPAGAARGSVADHLTGMVREVTEHLGFDDGVAPGTLDDGADLLPRATISLEQAVAIARGAAGGDLGEVDLETYDGRLVFNVDVGDRDVKVDAANGAVLGADTDD